MVTQAARTFIDAYADKHEQYVSLAAAAEDYVRSKLTDHDYSIHLISGRAKTPESLRAKVLLRPYEDPAHEIMDLVGIRVITYYAEQVDAIADRLKTCLTVNREHSLDKRSQLHEHEQFGYRSVHIIGKLTAARDPHRQYPALRGQTFEVQVRSVLDHAWAEVEHEIVYKSGIKFPPDVKRRFAAVAGSFEILEQEFVNLRGEADLTIDQYVEDYANRREAGRELDAARLVAALEVLRPGARGWRQAAKAGAPFAVPARTALAALRVVGITDYRGLTQTLRRQGCLTDIERVASLSGLAPDELPHLILVAVVVGYKDPGTLHLYFPDIANQTAVSEVFGDPTATSA